MSIKEIFFGKKNRELLTTILGEELSIDDTKKARSACENLLVNQMELVFKKNREKILHADPKKILPKLNDKAVNEAIKVYSAYMKSNNGSRGRNSSRNTRNYRNDDDYD